ncbi:hypothetical protein NMY22_g1319 [Coprinellus aureogranulatus]|nr:hypothetical protein NMY22_g1319 [Coprinellus aureogranulatus]
MLLDDGELANITLISTVSQDRSGDDHPFFLLSGGSEQRKEGVLTILGGHTASSKRKGQHHTAKPPPTYAAPTNITDTFSRSLLLVSGLQTGGYGHGEVIYYATSSDSHRPTSTLCMSLDPDNGFPRGLVAPPIPTPQVDARLEESSAIYSFAALKATGALRLLVPNSLRHGLLVSWKATLGVTMWSTSPRCSRRQQAALPSCAAPRPLSEPPWTNGGSKTPMAPKARCGNAGTACFTRQKTLLCEDITNQARYAGPVNDAHGSRTARGRPTIHCVPLLFFLSCQGRAELTEQEKHFAHSKPLEDFPFSSPWSRSPLLKPIVPANRIPESAFWCIAQQVHVESYLAAEPCGRPKDIFS